MEKEALENRKVRVEIYSKIEETRSKKIESQQNEEKRTLEIQKLKLEIENEKLKQKELSAKKPELYTILSAASLHVVDNEKTCLSDPVIKNVWTDEELELIKTNILDRILK